MFIPSVHLTLWFCCINSLLLKRFQVIVIYLSSRLNAWNLSFKVWSSPITPLSSSVMSDSATPWTAACQASLFITNSRSLLKLMSINSVMPSNHLILCHPLLLQPSIFPSTEVFFSEPVLQIRWPKYWSLTFSISPFKEFSGLISFWIDWVYLLAVQGTLRSLFQHHSSKASIFQCSAFYIVQLSHPCMTTGKTIDFTRQTFVSKAMSLLFNMLSRLVITFPPRSKHLLISWIKFIKLVHWFLKPQPCLTQWNYESYHLGPPEIDGSWWRVLTKCGPLEKGMGNHFGILALRTPWTVWKGKKIGHWKMNSPGW